MLLMRMMNQLWLQDVYSAETEIMNVKPFYSKTAELFFLWGGGNWNNEGFKFC